jgi:hypothetical protein
VNLLAGKLHLLRAVTLSCSRAKARSALPQSSLCHEQTEQALAFLLATEADIHENGIIPKPLMRIH